jgi:putative transposase
MVEKDIHTLCEWREVKVSELSVQADHVQLVCSLPPKLSIADFMGF